MVLYTSVDKPFAEEVIAEFTRHANIAVLPLFDTEADKTTGLVRRLRAEAARPQADVFWSSEVFHTIALAEAGLFEPYLPDAAKDIPIAYRDAKDRWIGFALRARVLAYDPGTMADDPLPATWLELAKAPWAGKVVFANPLFGTTRGHLAALLAIWGEADFVRWVDALAAGGLPGRLSASNSHAVRQVAAGQFPLCATDTDDVYALQESGAAIRMVYPDLEALGQGGTLLIPNTVAVVKGAPHPAFARQLEAFLCSAYVEEALARSRSRNIPTRPALRAQLGFEMPPTSTVDYTKVAEVMPRAMRIVQDKWLR